MPEGVRTSTAAADQVTERSRFNNFPSLPQPQPLRAERRKPTAVQQLLDEIDEYYGESARLTDGGLTAVRFYHCITSFLIDGQTQLFVFQIKLRMSSELQIQIHKAQSTANSFSAINSLTLEPV